MPNITVIHPTDGDLRFLRKLIEQLSYTFTGDVNYLKLTKEYRSHDRAWREIENLHEDSLVCFFCHGRSNGLYSCKYRRASEMHLSYVLEEELFIRNDNFQLLSGKKIFCLACKSNGIAQNVINAGAKVFLGFDDINFDMIIRDEQNEEKYLARYCVHQKVKYLLRYSVYSALSKAINENWTFLQLYHYLSATLDKLSDNLILNNKLILKGYTPEHTTILKNRKCSEHSFHQHYKSAALCIQEIKNGMKLWGDGNCKISF